MHMLLINFSCVLVAKQILMKVHLKMLLDSHIPSFYGVFIENNF